MIDTGQDSFTGDRIKKIEKFIDGDFCLTYGDGLSSINVRKLINFHKKNKKLATVTAVKPAGRFGAMELKEDQVTSFLEKPEGDGGWINGGFFVLNKKIFKYISNSPCIWEREPLENLAKQKQLSAYKFNGFWYPMDTLRDKNYLEDLWNSKKAPWKSWDE
jgi:glucose-1-phosphate cytidylyltransferase